jgi:hypothetical protein
MTCTHHWILSAPNGPTSLGVCKYCEETKRFFNTDQEGHAWSRRPPKVVPSKRPKPTTKTDLVRKTLRDNPNASKADIVKATGLRPQSVYNICNRLKLKFRNV